jgi:GT2 family glycosyltransferase
MVQGRWSSFWSSVASLELPPGVVIRTGRGCSPAANRNGLIREALASQASWIWFLDDDLVFHPDVLRRLLGRLDDPEVEAVVPLSFQRQPPFLSLWFTRAVPERSAMIETLPPPGPLVPLAAATFGGLLIRTSALERMPQPWVTIGQIGPEDWNDDLFFCRQLAVAGVRLWGDSTVRIGHTTDIEVWPHYSEDTGWAVVFARNLTPFVMQPWGESPPVPDPVAIP